MNIPIKRIFLLLILTSGFSTTPALAFECGNVGTGDDSTQSDGAITTRLACGENAAASAPNSTAVGGNATASGNDSTALGVSATASAVSSTALGRASDATGENSTALGRASDATGVNSTALGRSSEATETNSTALGVSSDATGGNSTALGVFSNATGGSSTGVGVFSNATGLDSTALGRSSGATAESTTGIGVFASASADRATAIGADSNADGADNTALGYDADILPIFTNATAIGSRATVNQSNAMVLGAVPGFNDCDTAAGCNYVEVGMGTITPAAPLHIRRADGAYDAGILVEDASSRTRNRTMLTLVNNGNARIALENTANGARFEMGTNANNGNFIFIADGEPIFTLTPTGRVLFGIASNPTLDVFPDGNGTFRGTVTAVDYLMSSDVNEKQDIEEMPGNLVLAKLEQLPVTEWAYKKDPESRHIGPMAQDFKKVFNLGTDETKINPADMAGVSLAAIKAQQIEIKALKAENAKLKSEKDAEIQALKAQQIADKKAFEARFAALEARLIAQ